MAYGRSEESKSDSLFYASNDGFVAMTTCTLFRYAAYFLCFVFKRNPSIKFYGLPWTFPGWLGGGNFTPYYNRTKLVTYIMNWIHGAKQYYDIDIDYIGVTYP